MTHIEKAIAFGQALNKLADLGYIEGDHAYDTVEAEMLEYLDKLNPSQQEEFKHACVLPEM